MKKTFLGLLTLGLVVSSIASAQTVSNITSELLVEINDLRSSKPAWLEREMGLGAGRVYMESIIGSTDSKYLKRCMTGTSIPWSGGSLTITFDQQKMCRKHFVPVINEIVVKRELIEEVALKFKRASELTKALREKIKPLQEDMKRDRAAAIESFKVPSYSVKANICLDYYTQLGDYFEWHTSQLKTLVKGYEAIKDLTPVEYSKDNSITEIGEKALKNYYAAVTSLKNGLSFYLSGTPRIAEELLVKERCQTDPAFN